MLVQCTTRNTKTALIRPASSHSSSNRVSYRIINRPWHTVYLPFPGKPPDLHSFLDTNNTRHAVGAVKGRKVPLSQDPGSQLLLHLAPISCCGSISSARVKFKLQSWFRLRCRLLGVFGRWALSTTPLSTLNALPDGPDLCYCRGAPGRFPRHLVN